MRERTAEVNRLQKTLEGANIKLASVVSDVTGVSARAMLARAGGRAARTRRRWPSWRRGSCGASGAELEQALTGRMSAHQRFLLAQHLAHIDFLDEQIAAVSARDRGAAAPF